MPHPTHEGGPRRAPRLLLLLLSLLLAGTSTATNARAATAEPTLRLFGPSDGITIYRYGKGEPVYVDLGVLVGSVGAPFELEVKRSDYTQAPTLEQVLYSPSGQRVIRPLDAAMLDGWNGLADFFEVSFEKNGATLLSTTQSFCPGGWQRERIDDSGPDVPLYPTGCYANPFTKGAVWGIDEGWAVGTSGGAEPPLLDIPNGLYSVTMRVADRYVDTFALDPSASQLTMAVRVRTMTDFGCEQGCFEREAHQTETGDERGTRAVPADATPDPASLPDLIALPSWGINVENRRTGRATLNFGATVWNGGAADLVVEGFRRSDEAVMDAFQYFYEDGEVVGKAPAGELGFDERDGHDHWHFKQFAAYSLLDDQGNEVRASRKEAFCLAPTDAIDLTLPNADWNPGSIGLATACGGPSSIWVREILSLGWGDTYFQGLPGQSFWITNLPNGIYYIKVEANPGGLLYETSAANNVELRQIRIRGHAGERRVVVPAWNGIDTEDGFGRG